MLADFLYGLLLVVSALAVIAVFRHIRKLRRTSNTPSEHLFILMFALLFGVLLGYLLINKQLEKLNVVDEGQIMSEKEVFVGKFYPPLLETQKQLNSQVISLKDLQKQIVALRDEHPQQKDRLQFSYSVWHRERKGLVTLKNELDKSIHSAWSHHNARENSFIDDQFSRDAVDWDKAIKTRLDEYHDGQLEVTNAMLDNVISQRKNLSEMVVGANAVAMPQGVVLKSVFSEKTVDKLLEALNIRSPKRAALLDDMSKEVNFTVQKHREVRNYSLDKPELQATLQRVMKEWMALENRAIYYRDQMLHAVQADYLARILGVNQRDSQLVRLEREINKMLPILLNDLNESRKALNKSYQFAPS